MPIEFQFRPMGKWPREQTASSKRKRSPFEVTLDKTYRLLRFELNHLKAENPVVIQIAVEEADIRIDGLPRSSANPRFPGVIVSFRAAKLGPMEYACDSCLEWTDNMRAICLTLERLRLIDAYGCTSRNEQYTGWRALPPPLVTPPPMTVEDAARFVVGIGGGAFGEVIVNRDAFRKFYRNAAALLHPDANGHVENPNWKILQTAKAVLDQHHAEAK